MVEDLRIYQSALNLVVEVYVLIRKHQPLGKDFSLNDQIKRASISVVANIAEGYLRSPKQFQNYLKIALGSANEVIALLQIVAKVYHLDTSQLQNQYRILARQIATFSKTINH